MESIGLKYVFPTRDMPGIGQSFYVGAESDMRPFLGPTSAQGILPNS